MGGETSAGAAAETLFDRYYLGLVRLAVQLVDGIEAAEDVVQDVFVSLQGRPLPDEPLRYLRAAVVNRSRSALRRRRSARNYAQLHQDLLPDAPGADEALILSERSKRFLAAVDALPRRQREVVALRYYEDLTVGEIATVLSLRSSAVSQSLRRALDTLARNLTGERYEQ